MAFGRRLLLTCGGCTYVEGVGFDGRMLVLTGLSPGYLVQVAPASENRTLEVELDATGPKGVHWGGRYVWVGNVTLDVVRLHDLATGQAIRGYDGPWAYAMGVSGDDRAIWLCDPTDDLIYQMDASTAGNIRSIGTPAGNTTGLAFDGRTFYARDHDTNTFYQVDPVTGTTIRSAYLLATNAQGLAYDGRVLYSLDQLDGRYDIHAVD